MNIAVLSQGLFSRIERVPMQESFAVQNFVDAVNDKDDRL